MKHAAKAKINQHRVAGVIALSPRPTKLAAALIATAISIPFVVIVCVVDLMT